MGYTIVNGALAWEPDASPAEDSPITATIDEDVPELVVAEPKAARKPARR